MSSRKKRPVLYEVARPGYQHRAPATPPSTSRPDHNETPPAPPVAAPRPTMPAPAIRQSAEKPAAAGRPRDPRAITVTSPILTAAVAGTIMLLFIAFVSGRRYEARYPSAPPTEFAFDLENQPDATTSAATIADARDPAPAAPRSAEAQPSAAPGRSPAQPPRTVTLEKGVHYVVVQHFRNSRRTDADAAAKFLLTNDVPCALHAGEDIRLIATEPFLIDQPDAEAGRRERTRANRLIQRIKSLGEQFNKEMLRQGAGGYTFSGCKLWVSK